MTTVILGASLLEFRHGIGGDRPPVRGPRALRVGGCGGGVRGDPRLGRRAAPGVLIVPLQAAFGWNAAVISGAVSLNILLFGLVGPFAAGLIQTIGLQRTVLTSMVLLVVGAGLSAFVSEIWQLYLTWGVLVGLGSGAGMIGLATAIANRWFVRRRGLVVGLLTAGNASGQLVFLPLLASLV